MVRIGLLAVVLTSVFATPTLAAADTTRPAAVWRSPQVNATVGTDAVVSVTFSEPVLGVSTSSLYLRDAASGQVIASTVVYNASTRTATLWPNLRLTIASTYRVSLTDAIRDAAGNRLLAFSWQFLTTNRVRFEAGTYTGYRYDPTFSTFVAVRRGTLERPSGAPAAGYRRINRLGMVLITDGMWEGYWVHATRAGEARHDGVAPITPRPDCGYVDLPTARAGYAQWATTVLDTLFRLPSTYAPGDLVDTSRAGLNGGYLVRSVAVADLRAMVEAASADGAQLAVQSAYRSHASQVTTFDYWVSVSGYAAALKISARPGHSEHQLGTTIDFRSAGGPAPWNLADWATTAEGSWMKANAWRYGWVMSYPQGEAGTSCYSYEPWHYRYVGREVAAAIQASGRVPRAWLWSQGFGVR